MDIEDKGVIESGKDLDDIYFLKIGKIRYLKSNSYKKGCCQICGKKRKTTAHHLVPKRLRCICPHISELRVRVCSECDEQFYPENKFIKESDVVARQFKKIVNLQKAIRNKDKNINRTTSAIKNLKNNLNILFNLDSINTPIVNDKNKIRKEVNKDDKK